MRKNRLSHVICVTAFLSVLVAPARAAQFTPVTGAIEVSDHSVTGQRDISIAMTAGGNSVVVWADQTGRDGNDEGVFAQRFDAQGRRVGGNFQVNVEVIGRQTDPRAEFSPDGSKLLIAWESEQEAYARIFSVSMDPFELTPAGEPFAISTLRDASFGDNTRNLSFFPDGSFVVVFMSWDGDFDGVSARRFNPDGTPKDATDIFINGQIAADQTDCSVLALEDGSFVAVWASGFEGAPGELGTDGQGNSIQMQIIQPDGSARFKDTHGNSEVTVNSYAAGQQEVPNLAMGADGRILVVWEDGGFEDLSLPGDASEGEVVGRFINSQATSIGDLFSSEQFVINPNTSLDVDEVWVGSVGSQGGFIVAWEGDADPDGNPFMMLHGEVDESVVMLGLDAVGAVVVDPVVVPEDNSSAPNDDPYVAVSDSILGITWTQGNPELGPKKAYVRFFSNPFPSPVEDWLVR